MANIEQELTKFREAARGEDVRGALISSVTAMNDELVQAVSNYAIALEAANSANNAAQSAVSTFNEYKWILNQTQFNNYLELIRNAIDGTVAGEIQNELDKIKAKHNPCAGYSNAHYRGKKLNCDDIDLQLDKISSGTFEDIYVGDYWDIDGIKWYVAGCDYYYGTGENKKNKNHHIVVVPDQATVKISLSMIQELQAAGITFNGPAYISDGFSKVFAQNLNIQGFNCPLPTIPINLLFETEVNSSGAAQNARWESVNGCFLCEEMIFGHWKYKGSSRANPKVESAQLPLFRHDPSKIAISDSWVLRDAVGVNKFALVEKSGIASDAGTLEYLISNEVGIRPFFAVG